ncbi:protein FAM131C [Candoia aspera]|uniref:protein FAM131C n=1 Tax=Candoia aspera TaxID=51853 RepID=UPI002FD86CBE
MQGTKKSGLAGLTAGRPSALPRAAPACPEAAQLFWIHGEPPESHRMPWTATRLLHTESEVAGHLEGTGANPPCHGGTQVLPGRTPHVQGPKQARTAAERGGLLTNAKEGGAAPLPDQPTAAPQKGGNPPDAPPQEGTGEKSFQGSSGATSGAYNVTALATSSLLGLLQTIKDHVTKPTAMAQGRVAHLIEWKGWSPNQVGWGQAPPEEALYEELTDELKEARFAAGVAEQFAITEATLSVWPSLDEEAQSYGRGSEDAIQLPDLEGLCLQENLRFCPPALAGGPRTFLLSTRESPIPDRPSEANGWGTATGGSGRGDRERASLPGSLRQQRSATSLRYADSSSPSEDEVFYD